MIAALLDNNSVTTQAAANDKGGFTSFDFSESSLAFRALLLVAHGHIDSGGTVFPRIIQVEQAYYSGSVEMSSARNQSPMIGATFRGIRHTNGKIVSFRKMTADKTSS